MHYVDMDKRMDEWVAEDACGIREPPAAPEPKKRKRGRPPRAQTHSDAAQPEAVSPRAEAGDQNGAGPTSAPREVVISEEDFDLRQHKQLTAQRNFDMVVFDSWKIKPWCVSRGLPRIYQC